VPRLVALEDRTLPSTFLVWNLDDHGPGSLRQAVLDANANPGPDLVQFSDELAGTIRLTSGQLNITDPTGGLTIDGPGAARLAVSGNGASRVFGISPGTSVTIDRVAITGGRADKDAPGFAGFGGGILNQGNLTLTDVLVAQNLAVGDAGVTRISPAGFPITGGGGGAAASPTSAR
jgi:hypothetical protein